MLLDGLGRMELTVAGVEPAGRGVPLLSFPMRGTAAPLSLRQEQRADRKTDVKCLWL